MTTIGMRAKWPAVAVGAALGMLPIVLYWIAIARVPSVTPAEARALVRDGAAVLVDVRDREAFEQRRIAGAIHWPLEQVLALKTPDALPGSLRGKRLLLLCDSGLTSAWATQKLRQSGLTEVFSVANGISAYTISGHTPCPLDVVSSLFAGNKPAPVRESPVYEQFALVFTGFGVKPFYMTLSFLLAVILWRSVAPDLVALRWSMVFFFLGEAACALNYLVFNLQAHFWEYLHSLGMVLSFGFLAYAVFEGMDLRLVHLSDPAAKCALLGLCRTCQQRTGGPCGMERCFLWLTAALWIVAWMPLCAALYVISYNTTIFGTTYNYSHPVLYQIFESRYCPVLALVFLAACFAVLAFKSTRRVPLAKVLFAAGVGPLSFSVFRLVVFGVYRDNIVWFNFWEEVTECILVMGVALVLWIFRSTLFPKRAQEAVSG